MAEPKIKDLCHIAAGKALWRPTNSDDRLEWALTAGTRKANADGTPATPPEGVIVTSSGTEVFEVISTSRTSRVFGTTRSNCMLVKDTKKMVWFAERGDFIFVAPSQREVRGSMRSGGNQTGGWPPSVKPFPVNQDELDLLAQGQSDNEPLPASYPSEDNDGTPIRIYQDPEWMTAREAERAERREKRLQMALREFGALNLEVRARVEAIRVKYSLQGTWVGGVSVKTSEEAQESGPSIKKV